MDVYNRAKPLQDNEQLQNGEIEQQKSVRGIKIGNNDKKMDKLSIIKVGNPINKKKIVEVGANPNDFEENN